MLSVLILAGLLQSADAAAEPLNAGAFKQQADAPVWMRRPSASDFARYYPRNAERAGIEGRATIACTIDTKGFMEKCEVVREEPAGQGFGAAALALGPGFKLTPKTPSGISVVGSKITIPIAFRLPH